MTKRKKRPIIKKWWFWLALGIILGKTVHVEVHGNHHLNGKKINK